MRDVKIVLTAGQVVLAVTMMVIGSLNHHLTLLGWGLLAAVGAAFFGLWLLTEAVVRREAVHLEHLVTMIVEALRANGDANNDIDRIH